MSAYFCKCCGAALDVKGSATVCRCSHCDVLQTVPRLDIDEKAILWERADKLRRAGEYDRAEGLYRELLAADDSEPEIYWCIMLCRYGIEYVEEHGSRKRTPTINRFSYKPILDDEDYRAAVRLADGDRRRLYILQSKELENLRRRVLAVSQTERPYDIFICYKETDRSGRRTEDSVLAAGLYRSLAADGYRVFFARVTLEDKTGREYEPYIFSAINSAKLMFALGSSPENFNAPWVKNEWSRYLTRVSESGEGTLAVLYSGMRREDLPAEFAHLQAFDMSAPDFTEELLRGVHKIISEETREDVSEDAAQTFRENAAGLLRRAEIMLDDGDFSRAEELCENALNLEPENAEIYLVKLLAGFKARSLEQLGELSGDFEQSSNYRMIMRFGDERMKSALDECRRSALYNRYKDQFDRADTEELYLAAAERFKSLDGFKDSARMAEKCVERIREAKLELAAAENERVYVKAKRLLQGVSRGELSSALPLLAKLGDYRDSAVLFEEANARIAALDKEREAALYEAEEGKRRRRERSAKLRKRAFKLAAVVLPAAAVVVIVCTAAYNVSHSNRYKSATVMRDRGDFDGAAAAFSELKGYSDSEKMFIDTLYQKALSLYERQQYAEAEKAFGALGNYSDSAEYVKRSKYARACIALEENDPNNALILFETLGDWSDSAEKAKKARYGRAELLRGSGKFKEAAEAFGALGDYSDSAALALECQYAHADSLFESKDYGEARKAFALLGDYSDSAERADGAKYALAERHLSDGEFDKARSLFSELGDFRNSPDRVKETDLMRARALADKEDYKSAVDILKGLNYPGAAELLTESEYKYALQLLDSGDYNRAAAIFTRLDDYMNSAEMYNAARYGIACDMLDDDMFDEAQKVFAELGDYSDSAQRLADIDRLRFVRVKRGETIRFGKKPNSSEELEWLVIRRWGTRVLVVSSGIIQHSKFGSATWEDSPVREYLNGEFFNSAFSDEEQTMIPTVTLENRDSEYGAYGGSDTEDRVFLLSADDVMFMNEKERRPREDGSGSYEWWLRDTGKNNCHKYVAQSTDVNVVGEKFDSYIGIRPAIWIEMGE